MKEYFKIGKLVAAHGLKGDLILRHNLGKKNNLKDIRALFIEDNNGTFLPWFITTAKARSNEEILLKIEGIDTREKALPLVQKETWLPEADFKKTVAKSAPINLLGYSVINSDKDLGPILEVIEQPHQVLCRIEMNKKEVLIPLNEQTIKKIDHKNKNVLVELPEGLLEIYLS